MTYCPPAHPEHHDEAAIACAVSSGSAQSRIERMTAPYPYVCHPFSIVSLVASRPEQRDLILILARDLTSRLAPGGFGVAAAATLGYFTEAPEPVLGASYAETGELPAGGW